jgi:Tfp pilus assembly protein PilF
MRRTLILLTFIAFGISLLSISGCGPKQRAKEGLLDTPESHYNQGMRKFESGNIDEAETQFADAISLNAKYASAYAGLSLVNAAKGAEITDAKSKERKQYFDNAKKMLEKAKDLNDKDINVWIAQIRVATIMKQDEDWIEDCRKALEKALKINPKSDEAYYFMGLAYKQAYDFKQSEDMLRQAIDIDGAWSEKAGDALKTVHKIVEAQPGTKYGKIIALEEKINRADLAVLFIEELNVVERIQRRDASTQAPDLSFKAENPLEFPQLQPTGQVEILDISGHWAESMIRDFVQTGLFDVMQDHKFYPNMPVTRIEFAGAVQRLIYMVTRDPSIFSKYIGEKESHIRDMRTDHPYYGAAMLAVERDIMDLDKINGYFYPDQNVSGPDALLIIRDIKNALKW